MITNYEDQIAWCVRQHENTNHTYGEFGASYAMHLKLAHNVAKKHMNLLTPEERMIAHSSIWGHDLIEDARVTYSDVAHQLGNEVADVIYAVTNEKGKTRKERASDAYYAGIQEDACAVFVKLCDRIANIKYSKLMENPQFAMYRKENTNFEHQLGRFNKYSRFEAMFAELDELLEVYQHQ